MNPCKTWLDRASRLAAGLSLLAGPLAFCLSVTLTADGSAAEEIAVRPVDWARVAILELAPDPAGDADLEARLAALEARLLVRIGDLAWSEIPPDADPELLRSGVVEAIHREPWLPLDAQGIEAATSRLLQEVRSNLESTGVPFETGRHIEFGYADGLAAESGFMDGGDQARASAQTLCNLDYFAWPPVSDPFLGHTHVMMGRVLMTLIFLESEAGGEDVYSWTGGQIDTAIAKAQGAALWWAYRASVMGRNLSFTLVARTPGFVYQECYVPWEPTRHSKSFFGDTIVPYVAGRLGFDAPYGTCGIGRFNGSQLGSFERSFTAFLCTGESYFGGGPYFAWAYLNGPYLVTPYNPDGWGTGWLDAVIAHEMGHIFRACDEYYDPGYGGCPNCNACIAGAEPNGNCEAGCWNSYCIMWDGDLDSPCAYTRDQIGWDGYPIATLISPPAGAVLSSPAVPLEASAFGATIHAFRLSLPLLGCTLTMDVRNVPGTTWTTDPLPNGSYEWRALGMDQLGNYGSYSPPRGFSVATPTGHLPAGAWILAGLVGESCTPSWVKVSTADGTVQGPGFFALSGEDQGVEIAAGDLDGDGTDELLAWQTERPESGAFVSVLNAGTWDPRLGFDAYPGLGGGASVALGDLNGDGRAEIVTGAGSDEDNPALVKIWDPNGMEIASFDAFPQYPWGVRVAVGDVDGDGSTEIVTGTGTGEDHGSPAIPPIVRVFSAAGQLEAEFVPGDEPRGGTRVATADIDGDGVDEIVTASGAIHDSGDWVRVWRLPQTLVLEFEAGDGGHVSGTRIAAGDLDGDGADEILTGSIDDRNVPRVHAFDGNGIEILTLEPFANGIDGGASVALLRSGPATPSAVAQGPGQLPILRPFRNPVRPGAEMAIRSATTPAITVVDIGGRVRATLDAEERGTELFTASWTGLTENGSTLSPGIYLVRIRAGGRQASLKVVVTR